MFSLRQIFRLGARLALTRDHVNLRQTPKGKLNVSLFERTIVRTNTNLVELPKDEDEKVHKIPISKIVGKLKLMFTCKCCNFRNSRIISKLAYQKGVVIVRCDGCKNNHLIADNLGWFAEFKGANVERLLAAKGETIRKVQNDIDGYIEVVAKAELDMIDHNRGREENDSVDEESKTQIRYEKVGTPEKT